MAAQLSSCDVYIAPQVPKGDNTLEMQSNSVSTYKKIPCESFLSIWLRLNNSRIHQRLPGKRYVAVRTDLFARRHGEPRLSVGSTQAGRMEHSRICCCRRRT